ncbi:hypothetical protein AKJ16_DCAP26455, partial [Drosera capensis]
VFGFAPAPAAMVLGMDAACPDRGLG